ncbi:MAG: 50S ribosomal protein L44e [Candidatus Diapherotrites archaeon]|nr:50S ribosomal protein L44e [Candidatus Diapherotrites archaeon]
MNIPKNIKTYCKKCKKHTDHKLKQFKPAAARAVSKGQRKHLFKTKQGYGGKSKFPKQPKKQNKKPAFLAECVVCHQICYFIIPKRMKKMEFAEKK